MLMQSSGIHFTILLSPKVKMKIRNTKKYKNLNTAHTYPDVTLHS